MGDVTIMPTTIPQPAASPQALSLREKTPDEQRHNAWGSYGVGWLSSMHTVAQAAIRVHAHQVAVKALFFARDYIRCFNTATFLRIQ